MIKEELINYLSEYEVFEDDDFGGSYRSVIRKDKQNKVSRAFSSMSALWIVDSFESIQKENTNLKQALNEIKEYCSNTSMTVAEYNELLKII